LRDDSYEVRVLSGGSIHLTFADLYPVATKYAGGTDRWVEIQPGHMGFHFVSEDAYLKFREYVQAGYQVLLSAEIKKKTSKRFEECRELVRSDALEAQRTLRLVLPLLSGSLREIKDDYLHSCAVFLRRVLARYFALALCRLLEEPNNAGKTGTTASISNLLKMAESEDLLSESEVQEFASELETIKTEGAKGEYDLFASLRDVRNIQLAHRLIPWKDPTDEHWFHHLADFGEDVFDLVVDLDSALAEATGVTLESLPKSADAFALNAEQFWRSLPSMRSHQTAPRDPA
jgi:hypothetical protein